MQARHPMTHLSLLEVLTVSCKASSAVMNTVGIADACFRSAAGGRRARAAVLATTWLPRTPLARPKTASPGTRSGKHPGLPEGAHPATTPAQSAPVDIWKRM